jgi:hypothetical protein
MRSFLICLTTGLVVISLESPRASAQVLYGSLVGTIIDQTKAVIPTATVKVTNTETGLVREAATDSAGNY